MASPLAEPEIVAAHAVLGLEMADDGLDGGPAAQFALDPGCHASLLAGDEDPELVIGRRVVAAISVVGEEALDDVADRAPPCPGSRWPACGRHRDCRAAPSHG